jgi:hypothetical protein
MVLQVILEEVNNLHNIIIPTKIEKINSIIRNNETIIKDTEDLIKKLKSQYR